MPSAHVRLTALVVNYCSGAFAEACVASLRAEWARSGRAADDLDVIVVDNASPADQSGWLANLRESGTTVAEADDNLGYAKGMNLAWSHARWRDAGRPDDVVAILNPDLFFLPGSLDRLLDHLIANPEIGAIDPKATIDPGLGMNLPRNALPSVVEQVWSVLAQMNPVLCRAYSRRRLKGALPWWHSDEPIESDMLSGCCMLLRREVLDRLPAPMDERYPLYYEDADLCRTLGQMGYKLVHHTGAQVVHHWARSSGVGEQFAGEPMRRYWISQRAYYAKFSGPLGRGIVALANWAAKKWPEKRSFRPMHDIETLGVFTDEPVVIPLPRRARYLMEMALAPTWILTVGIFGEGEAWECSPGMWEWQFQAEYYMRAIDLDTGEFLGAWHYTKATPGRNHPLAADELAEATA
jgi:GT2 family glycosyltransferase